MGSTALDIGRRARPRFRSIERRTVERFEPLAALLLAVLLATAIATESILPDVWTKALLAMTLPLDIVTAIWLTRSRS